MLPALVWSPTTRLVVVKRARTGRAGIRSRLLRRARRVGHFRLSIFKATSPEPRTILLFERTCGVREVIDPAIPVIRGHQPILFHHPPRFLVTWMRLPITLSRNIMPQQKCVKVKQRILPLPLVVAFGGWGSVDNVSYVSIGPI